MKNVKIDIKKFFLYLGMLLLVVSLGSCSDDDDVVTPEPDEATGTITASNQTLSGNTLIVENVTVGQDSWLVARNAGSEGEADIVSEAVFLEEGSHDNVEVPLTNTANLTGNVDGDDFVLMLHEDDPGTGAGTFDYDGISGVDNPINNNAGAPVRTNVNVRAPGIDIDDDQMLTENNEVTFNSVTIASDGWVSIYGSNEDGTINEDDLVGQRFVEAGTYENFTVPFNEGYVAQPGVNYYPQLNVDDPADQAFTYTPGGNEDVRETYGFDTTSGSGLFVENRATTATPGAFTVGSSTGTTGTN